MGWAGEDINHVAGMGWTQECYVMLCWREEVEMGILLWEWEGKAKGVVWSAWCV